MHFTYVIAFYILKALGGVSVIIPVVLKKTLR